MGFFLGHILDNLGHYVGHNSIIKNLLYLCSVKSGSELSKGINFSESTISNCSNNHFQH